MNEVSLLNERIEELSKAEYVNEKSVICAVEHDPDDWRQYWDDLSGKELRADLVEAARAEEL